MNGSASAPNSATIKTGVFTQLCQSAHCGAIERE